MKTRFHCVENPPEHASIAWKSPGNTLPLNGNGFPGGADGGAPSARRPPADPDYAQGPVPASARKGHLPMAFILLGFTFFSATMALGALLANQITMESFAGAALAGGACLAAYASVLACIGCRTGLSFDLLSRRAFGTRGSWLPSTAIAVTQAGWFGVGVAMFARPAADLLHVPVPAVALLAGACMTASAYVGIRGLEIVSYVSVPLIAALGGVSMAKGIGAAGGVAHLFPATADAIPPATATALVVGTFISGATTLPNFTRFAKGRASVVVATVVAFFGGTALMLAFGAVAGAVTGQSDIFYAMIAQGLAIPAVAVLGANIWTTNDNAIYSSARGLANLTGCPKRPLVLVAGTVATLASGWLFDHFVWWLHFLGSVLPPIGVVLVVDHFLPARAGHAGAPPAAVRLDAVLAALAGFAAAQALHWTIPMLAALLVPAVLLAAARLLARLGPRDAPPPPETPPDA